MSDPTNAKSALPTTGADRGPVARLLGVVRQIRGLGVPVILVAALWIWILAMLVAIGIRLNRMQAEVEAMPSLRPEMRALASSMEETQRALERYEERVRANEMSDGGDDDEDGGAAP